MPRYLLKKHTVTYKGKMYNSGDAIELDEFDSKLPSNWFDEIIADAKRTEPIVEETKKVKTKTTEED
ncbi:MAG: hypothetical protein ACW991_00695 [Candidatus Hodarchaeales archaeon]|jgi:uncharacterized protein YcnI